MHLLARIKQRRLTEVQSVPIPPGFDGPEVVKSISEIAASAEVTVIVQYQAYFSTCRSLELHEQLQSAGVTLCPSNPESAKAHQIGSMIATDLMTFALDRPAPAHVVLISGNLTELVYSISRLKVRGYQVSLIVPQSMGLSDGLVSSATVLQFDRDILHLSGSAEIMKHNSEGVQLQSLHPLSKETLPDRPSPTDIKGILRYYAPLIKTLCLMQRDPTLKARGIDVLTAHKSRQLQVKVASMLRAREGDVIGNEGFKEYIDFAARQGFIRVGTGSLPESGWVEIVPSHDIIMLYFKQLKANKAKSGTQGRPSKIPDERYMMPLITLLAELPRDTSLKSRGIDQTDASITRQLRSRASSALIDRDRTLFIKAGTTGWAQYAALAESMGIIRMGTGAQAGSEWVELLEAHPLVQSVLSVSKSAAAQGSSAPLPNHGWCTVDRGGLRLQQEQRWLHFHTRLWQAKGDAPFFLNNVRVRGKYSLLVCILQDQRRIGHTSTVPFVYGLYTKLHGQVYPSQQEFVDDLLEPAHMKHIVDLWPRNKKVPSQGQFVVLHPRLCAFGNDAADPNPLHFKPLDPYCDEVRSLDSEDLDTGGSE